MRRQTARMEPARCSRPALESSLRGFDRSLARRRLPLLDDNAPSVHSAQPESTSRDRARQQAHREGCRCAADHRAVSLARRSWCSKPQVGRFAGEAHELWARPWCSTERTETDSRGVRKPAPRDVGESKPRAEQAGARAGAGNFWIRLPLHRAGMTANRSAANSAPATRHAAIHRGHVDARCARPGAEFRGRRSRSDGTVEQWHKIRSGWTT